MIWFTRLRNWAADAANGIKILPDYHDSEDNNFAAGINLSLNIAGNNSPTADIPWGTNKITGLKAGTLASDACRVDQAQTRTIAYAADSVGTDAYAITLSPALAAYAVGQMFTFAPGVANTGACTLNINGIGAKSIKKDYNVDPSDGDLAQNQMITVVYDGTNFQMQNAAHGLLNQSLSAIYAADGGGSDSYVITLSPAISSYATGQLINFKANTKNTGAATLNVNGLGAKTIKKDQGADLSDNDIAASQIVQVIYDGTNFQMLSPIFGCIGQNGQAIYAADAGATDTYAITLAPAPTAYATGMVVRFKANTINTGAATLNVNGLGAITIKKAFNIDLADGDIKASQLLEVIYDGTNFQLLSPVSVVGTVTSVATGSGLSGGPITGSGTLTAAAGVPLQVQQGTLTSTASSSSASFADTGVSVAITPASASNTVLIMATLHLGQTTSENNSVYVRLIRGASTVLIQGDAGGSKTRTFGCTAVANTTLGSGTVTLSYLDSPATTSATTYKIQILGSNGGGTVYVNRSFADTDTSAYPRGASTILAMEIKG